MWHRVTALLIFVLTFHRQALVKAVKIATTHALSQFLDSGLIFKLFIGTYVYHCFGILQVFNHMCAWLCQAINILEMWQPRMISSCIWTSSTIQSSTKTLFMCLFQNNCMTWAFWAISCQSGNPTIPLVFGNRQENGDARSHRCLHTMAMLCRKLKVAILGNKTNPGQ